MSCVFLSVWCHFIEAKTTEVYGYAILLGVGGSLSLVTCLGMLAHLIGENVVSENMTKCLLTLSCPQRPQRFWKIIDPVLQLENIIVKLTLSDPNSQFYLQVHKEPVCLCMSCQILTFYRHAWVTEKSIFFVLQETGAFVYGAMSFLDKLANGIAVQIIQLFHG